MQILCETYSCYKQYDSKETNPRLPQEEYGFVICVTHIQLTYENAYGKLKRTEKWIAVNAVAFEVIFNKWTPKQNC